MTFFNIGPMELILILVVILVVFGPNRLPEIGSEIGKTIKKFRNASKELSEEFDLEKLEKLDSEAVLDLLEAQAGNDQDETKKAGEEQKAQILDLEIEKDQAETATASLSGTHSTQEEPQSDDASGVDSALTERDEGDGTAKANSQEPSSESASGDVDNGISISARSDDGELIVDYDSPEDKP